MTPLAMTVVLEWLDAADAKAEEARADSTYHRVGEDG